MRVPFEVKEFDYESGIYFEKIGKINQMESA